MLPVNGLAYRRISDVEAGHLIYLFRDSGPAVAMRVVHPGGATGATDYPAALVFHGVAGNQRMPLTDAGVANQYCLDFGTRPSLRWRYPLEYADDKKQFRPYGPIVVIGDQPTLPAFYPEGQGDPLYWNLLTGASMDVPQNYCAIPSWSIGATGADGTYVPIATYPEDYGFVK